MHAWVLALNDGHTWPYMDNIRWMLDFDWLVFRDDCSDGDTGMRISDGERVIYCWPLLEVMWMYVLLKHVYLTSNLPMSFILWNPLIILVGSVAKSCVCLCKRFLSCFQLSCDLKLSLVPSLIAFSQLLYADSLWIENGLIFREIDTQKLIFSVSSRTPNPLRSLDSKSAFSSISSYGILISTDPRQNQQKQHNNLKALLLSASPEKIITYQHPWFLMQGSP